MKIKNILKQFFKKRKKNYWKNKYTVGRGTYGEPKIEHWGESTTLKVGNFCSISSGVRIFLGGNHRNDWITTYPFSVFRDSAKHIEGHPSSRGDVIIGNDVWIGVGAVILSGVKIGNGVVIGASAVVAKDIPPYCVAVGNPAKIVKTRFKQEEIEVLEGLNWWYWTDDKLDASMDFLLSGDVYGLKLFSKKYDSSFKIL